MFRNSILPIAGIVLGLMITVAWAAFWVSSFFVPLSFCFSTLLNDDETDRRDESPGIGKFDIRGIRGGCCCGLPDTVASRPWPRRPAAAGLHRKSTNRSSIISKDDLVQSRPPTITGLHQHRNE